MAEERAGSGLSAAVRPPPPQGTWGCWRQALRSSSEQRLGRCRCVRVCVLNPFLVPRSCTMLKILTKKLRNQSLNEIQPFQLKVRTARFVLVVFCTLQVTNHGALRS